MQKLEVLFQIPFDDASGPDDALHIYPRSQGLENEDEDYTNCVHECVLNTRGWTLQEKILSRRILYYGATQLFWSCRTLTISAYGCDAEAEEAFAHLPDQPLQHIAPSSKTTRIGHSDHQPSLDLYDNWYKLMHEYAQQRKLSKGTDKLPALGGIAKYIADRTGDQCIAGLWLADLCCSLLWQRACYVPYQRADPPRGPSWSWVNFEQVQFKGTGLKVLKSCIEVLGGILVLRAPVFEMSAPLRGSLRRTEPDFACSIFDYKDISEESDIEGCVGERT
jgi:hypothetical protein